MSALTKLPAGFEEKRNIARIPLMRQALRSEIAAARFRSVDATWEYEQLIPMRLSGFNPLHRVMYVQSNSLLQKWLTSDSIDERSLNQNDQLMFETLFFAHDYVHVWATAFIQVNFPRVGFGTRAISEEAIDDMAFCFLITEVAGTVALDYWYLSTVELESVVQIGTRYTGLAASYHERDLTEYRQFRPDLNVQTPLFFDELARLYCEGEIVGFDAQDLARSPKLRGWLQHELTYGKEQRQYCREWMFHLGGLPIPDDVSHQRRPLSIDKPWKREMVDALGQALWAKIKRGDMQEPSLAQLPNLEDVWVRRTSSGRHFCYTSVNGLDEAELRSSLRSASSDASGRYLAMQLASAYQTDANAPAELYRIAKGMIERAEHEELRYLLEVSGLRRLPTWGEEPADLFFRN